MSQSRITSIHLHIRNTEIEQLIDSLSWKPVRRFPARKTWKAWEATEDRPAGGEEYRLDPGANWEVVGDSSSSLREADTAVGEFQRRLLSELEVFQSFSQHNTSVGISCISQASLRNSDAEVAIVFWPELLKAAVSLGAHIEVITRGPEDENPSRADTR